MLGTRARSVALDQDLGVPFVMHEIVLIPRIFMEWGFYAFAPVHSPIPY
jgi:hypothetical protein